MLIKLYYANLNYANNIMIIHSSNFHPIVMKFGKHYGNFPENFKEKYYVG